MHISLSSSLKRVISLPDGADIKVLNCPDIVIKTPVHVEFLL